MQTSAADTRSYELDILRICACLAVVIYHTTGGAWGNSAIGSADWHVSNAFLTIGYWGVPCFLMISGALFLNPQKEVTLRSLAKKNILRLVTAYVFWSAWYTYQLRVFLCPSGKITMAAIYNFLIPTSHLWFIFTIIGLYLLTPLLRQVCQKREHARYLIILGFLLSICPNAVKLIPSLYDRLSGTMESVSFLTGIGYSTYYVTGYYLKTWKTKKSTHIAIYVAGTLSMAAIMVGAYLASMGEGKAVAPFADYLMPFVFFFSIAVFQLFQDCFSGVCFRERTKKLILFLSKLSFGVYLVHIEVLELVRNYGFQAERCPAILFIPLTALVAYFGSLLITWVISKIPVLNKFII